MVFHLPPLGHSRHITAVFGSSAPFKWLPVVVAPANVANASLQMFTLPMLANANAANAQS